MQVLEVRQIEDSRIHGKPTLPNTIFQTGPEYTTFLEQLKKARTNNDWDELTERFKTIIQPHFEEIQLPPEFVFIGRTRESVIVKTGYVGITRTPYNISARAFYYFKPTPQLSCTTQIEYASELDTTILEDLLTATVNTPTNKVIMPGRLETGEPTRTLYVAPATITTTLMKILYETLTATQEELKSIQTIYAEIRRNNGVVQEALKDAYKKRINLALINAKIIQPTTLN